MKVTVELTTEEEIKTFYARMFEPDKPNITMYAAPAPAPEPQALSEGSMPAPEEVPFAEEKPAPALAAAPAAVTFEMVQKAAIKMVQAQKQEEMRELLNKYGLQSLPELKAAPEKLAAFYADMGVI